MGTSFGILVISTHHSQFIDEKVGLPRARASAPQRKTSRSRELWEGIAVDYFLGTEVQGGSSGRIQLFVDFEKRVAF